MKSLTLLVGASALIATSAADATFVSWEVVNVGTVDGRDIYQVWAVFDNQSNVVLNCLQHQIMSGTMSALHTDSISASYGDGYGAWNASATAASTAATSNQYRDSYVTMTGKVGLQASTALDPSFGGGAGLDQGTIPYHAGWYTANPALPIVVGATLRIKQMQIALAAGDFGYTANLGMGYKSSTASTTALWGWGTYTVGVPAPGAVALLGLAGLVSRRRRA